jgi:hypothetical protein
MFCPKHYFWEVAPPNLGGLSNYPPIKKPLVRKLNLDFFYILGGWELISSSSRMCARARPHTYAYTEKSSHFLDKLPNLINSTG